MTLREEILEEHRIIQVSIFVVDIEVTLETTTLVGVEVGLKKDSTQVTLKEIREAVVDLD